MVSLHGQHDQERPRQCRYLCSGDTVQYWCNAQSPTLPGPINFQCNAKLARKSSALFFGKGIAERFARCDQAWCYEEQSLVVRATLCSARTTWAKFPCQMSLCPNHYGKIFSNGVGLIPPEIWYIPRNLPSAAAHWRIYSQQHCWQLPRVPQGGYHGSSDGGSSWKMGWTTQENIKIKIFSDLPPSVLFRKILNGLKMRKSGCYRSLRICCDCVRHVYSKDVLQVSESEIFWSCTSRHSPKIQGECKI